MNVPDFVSIFIDRLHTIRGPIMNDRRAQADRRKIDTGPPSGFRDRRRHDPCPPPEIKVLIEDMTTFTIRRLQYLAVSEHHKDVKH